MQEQDNTRTGGEQLVETLIDQEDQAVPTVEDGSLPVGELMDSGVLDEGVVASGATAMEQALDMLHAGGPVVAILIAMSVVAMAVVIVKLWQFARMQVDNRQIGRTALQAYKNGNPDKALALIAHAKSPVAQTLARAIRGKQRSLPESTVREEVLRAGSDMLEPLRSSFRLLEVVASLAPLLGLFGTVLGMIEAFQQLEAAGSQVNPAILSGGIWQALLTTAVGLAVAIPVVAILNWLESRVDGLAHEMESVVTQVFTEDLSQDMSVQDLSAKDSPEQLKHKKDACDEPTRLHTTSATEPDGAQAPSY